MSVFDFWLAKNHPDVRLTPQQAAFVAAVERGEDVVWVGGTRSGRSFVFGLLNEWLGSTAFDDRAPRVLVAGRPNPHLE